MLKWLVIVGLMISSLSFAAEPSAAPAWKGNASGSLLLTTGNTTNTTIGLGGTLFYQPEGWVFQTSTNYLVSKSGGVANAEAFKFDLRADRYFSRPLSAFVSLNYLTNRFIGFLNRAGAEGGIQYTFLQDAGHSLQGEAGLGAIYEYRTDHFRQTFFSGRLSALYAWKFSDNSELGAQVSLIDNLGNMADWRLATGISLTTMMTQLLSLRFGFNVDYINRPVPGKLPTDTTTTVSLVAQF